MRRLLIVVLGFAMAAAACSSDPGDGAVDNARGAALPFDAVLIDLLGTDDIDRYRWDIQRNAEQLLVDCMAESGFEFTIQQPLPPGPSEAELGDRDYAETRGFGIVHEFRSWIEDLDVDAQNRDLNAEYLRTLNGAEIQSYFLALDGEPPEPGQLPDANGCRTRAADEAYATWNSFLEALPNYTAMGEERDTHPEWLAARGDWRECMAEAGYDYSEPEAIRSDVSNRMGETVVEAYPDGLLPLVRLEGEWQIDPEVEPLLDELEAFEIAAAVASFDCNEPLADRFAAVEREVQQGFVDRNQATIDTLLGS